MFKIELFERVDSTNDLAREYDYGTVILASEQTSGKGRFNRRWESSRGGLWFSIVLKPKRRLFEYTFIASLSVIRSLRLGKIKWPNDIIYRRKKLCGILSEAITIGEKTKIIIGIGININNIIPDELKSIAISLSKIKGKAIDCDKILNKVLDNFEKLNAIEFDKILEEYKKNCIILGKHISIKKQHEVITGKVRDIDYDGNLILESQGKIISLNEGDVSLS
jgi:BirA family transcriptional regulator, biotin operon repressor / biotin---[acetyl-CoA-carboxylase] ligase